MLTHTNMASGDRQCYSYGRLLIPTEDKRKLAISKNA